MEVENSQKSKQLNSFLAFKKQNYIQLQSGNSSARCSLQTSDTQIICTLVGPYHGIKVNQQDCEIKGVINYLNKQNKSESKFHSSEQIEEDIVQRKDLLNLLSELIDVKKYPKSILSFSFDVIAVNGPIFPYLVNIAAYALYLAGISIVDMFASASAGFIDGKPVIDPTEEQSLQMEKQMCVVQTKNSQRIVYLDMKGSLDFDEIQKLLSVTISGCTKIQNFISQLLISSIEA